MGMYDSLEVRCPTCGTFVTFQSKAGDCVLDTFCLDNVPSSIADDLNGTTKSCSTCGDILKVNSIVISKVWIT